MHEQARRRRRRVGQMEKHKLYPFECFFNSGYV